MNNKKQKKAASIYFFKTFPLYLAYSMAISLHNGVAVLEGLFGIKSPFIRTPKFNELKDISKELLYYESG